MIDLRTFNTKEERFSYLKENKKLIIAEKKSSFKKADSISGFIGLSGSDGKIYSNKSEMASYSNEPIKDIRVKVVINSCLIMDSHMDVHIPKLWNKSVKENKYPIHLQEHEMEFKNIISDADDVKVSVENIDWSKLNMPYSGKVECLVFDSLIKPDRNSYMYEQYSKGYVRQHSVGMRYVALVMCVNSEERYWAEEKDNWDKYYPMVMNKEIADEYGCFFAITEAKYIEGSAVVLGSNQATPTLSIIENNEPPNGTQSNKQTAVNLDTVANFTKLKINQK